MLFHNKTLQLISSKLGLGDEEKVLSKADEFERLLKTKLTAGSKMSDTSKIVICLDLAADIFGVDFDVKLGMKYTALKPAIYNNFKKTVANLLGINDEKLTISSLCLTLDCSVVQTLADKILEEFQEQAKLEVDLNLPQYVCMAVYQACRVNKVKISKSKLILKSGLKAVQWTKMDASWTKFVNEKFAVTKKKGRPSKTVDQKEEDILEKMDVDIPTKQKLEPVTESYENWKRRMLDTAYKELTELEKVEKLEEKKQSTSPRKSPRKTPAKYSPYKIPFKSPTKKNSIKLVFPVKL